MGELRILSKCHTSRHPVEMWHRRCSSKIPSTTCVWWGQSFARKTTTPDEILLSLAADAGADTNQTHNNQPNKHFHAHLRRASLQFWVDWATVALLVSLLIRGPFSRVLKQHRLIVLNYVFSCNNSPMKLKLSHEQRSGVGQPRECPCLTLQMCSGQERGAPW